MKKIFLNFSVNLINKNKNYTDEQMEIILYGLEGIYLSVTKMVVLICLAYFLGIMKEFFLVLISYNIIRSQAFGIHATKSIYCLISSIILFIGGALLSKFISLPFGFSIVVMIICDICLLLYAPADTYKRPIVNKKKRKRFKILSFAFGIIYTILVILFKEDIIVNFLVIGMVEAVLMILPITYKVFNLPYDNYKNYHRGV